jgi:hypothetical protein
MFGLNPWIKLPSECLVPKILLLGRIGLMRMTQLLRRRKVHRTARLDHDQRKGIVMV